MSGEPAHSDPARRRHREDPVILGYRGLDRHRRIVRMAGGQLPPEPHPASRRRPADRPIGGATSGRPRFRSDAGGGFRRRRNAGDGRAGAQRDHPTGSVGQEAEHSGDHGRRHRLVQPELLPPGDDAVPDPEHRPDRQRRGPLHRLVRAELLYRRTGGVSLRPVADPDRASEGRCPGRSHRHPERGPDRQWRFHEESRVRNRAVRQEPPWRAEPLLPTVHGVRRVFRQPLSP